MHRDSATGVHAIPGEVHLPGNDYLVVLLIRYNRNDVSLHGLCRWGHDELPESSDGLGLLRVRYCLCLRVFNNSESRSVLLDQLRS